MKKSYVKPQVYFENFQLSASIAGDCEVIVKNQSKGTCGYKMSGDMVLFTTTDPVNVCATQIEDGNNSYKNLCYHGPYSDYNVFRS